MGVVVSASSLYNFHVHPLSNSCRSKMSTLDARLAPHPHKERDALEIHSRKPRVVVLDRRASA